MNPDENNTNQEGAVPPVAPAAPETPPMPPEASPEIAPEVVPAPEAPIAPEPIAPEPVPEVPAPEAPAEPEAPNLDQVAADLANAAPADVAPDTTPAEPEAAPETSVIEQPAPEVTPEAPIAPEIPPMDTPAVPPVPEAPIAPAAPEVTPEAPEAPATPENPAEAAPQEDSYPSSSANFVDDAQNPEEKPAETSPENEEPLVPAEPVPGSIGSALAYSDTAPNHAVPVGKTSKFKLSFGKKSAEAPVTPDASAELASTTKSGRKPLTKENLKLLIAIVGGVTLVAVVAVVIFFILNSGSKTSTTRPAENNDTQTNVVTSLTCTLSGDAEVFGAYGNVLSGNSQIIAMYSDDVLSSFGTTLKLTFDDEESAKNAQLTERNLYSSKIKNAGLTEDPFASSYDTSGKTMTATHQAEGDDIDSQSAKVLGFYVIKGEPQTDIDTLLDSYETDGYTCVQK